MAMVVLAAMLLVQLTACGTGAGANNGDLTVPEVTEANLNRGFSLYGIFGTIIKAFESLFQNYLLAILLFALCIKVLLFPFGIRQQKNQQKQASLRAKEVAILKKYKGRENDQRAMQQRQQELQQMYQDNNYNQFAGCLPMLIQLPIILIVYQAVVRPLAYICKFSDTAITAIINTIKSAPLDFGVAADAVNSVNEMSATAILNKPEYFAKMCEKIPALSGTRIPNFTLFGQPIGETPTALMTGGWTWLWILVPFLVFGAQYLSMILIRKLSYQPPSVQNAGCSVKVMDFMFPAMTLMMSFGFPVLLSFYWIFQSLLGVLQQLILKLIWPMPVLTEEDYKNAERALRGKAVSGGSGNAAPAGSRNYDPNKKYRSLHTIDEDDDDLPAVVKPAQPEPEPEETEKEETDATSRKESQAESQAPVLKKDNPKRKK